MYQYTNAHESNRIDSYTPVLAERFTVFHLQFHSGVPIYRQIMEQVLHMIDRGQLETGALLPSVRTLGLELGVNPMTISRAYSQLETDGVVERKRGVGMVVIGTAKQPDTVLQPAIERLVADARQLKISERELIKRIRDCFKETMK